MAMPQNLHKIMDLECDISIKSCHVICRVYRIDPINTVPCIALFQHDKVTSDRVSVYSIEYIWMPH